METGIHSSWDGATLAQERHSVPYPHLLFQVTNAQNFGAKAILIYNDPQDFAPVPDEDLYPHGWWLPRSGVQRGSILIGTGDPLTPRYPSKGADQCVNLCR